MTAVAPAPFFARFSVAISLKFDGGMSIMNVLNFL